MRGVGLRSDTVMAGLTRGWQPLLHPPCPSPSPSGTLFPSSCPEDPLDLCLCPQVGPQSSVLASGLPEGPSTPTGGPPIPGLCPASRYPKLCCHGPLPTPSSQTPGLHVLALPEPSIMEATAMPASLLQASSLGTRPSPSGPPACHPTPPSTQSLLQVSGRGTGAGSGVRLPSSRGRGKACSNLLGA